MLVEDVDAAVQRVNASLVDANDEARIRFVSVEQEPYGRDGLLVVLVWELPEPTNDTWPLEVLDAYCAAAAEEFRDIGDTQCLFRTSSELHEGPPIAAVAVDA